ncbi:MAG: hypothetical protein NVSMB47_01120 [Polyangiales bacterium]
MRAHTLPRLFDLVTVGFAAAALFHLAALVAPSLAEPSPPWRHALFVVVDASIAFGIRRRGPVFLGLFALFAGQQLASHGAQALGTWAAERRVDVASIVVLAAVPLLCALLLVDAWARRAQGG